MKLVIPPGRLTIHLVFTHLCVYTQSATIVWRGRASKGRGGWGRQAKHVLPVGYTPTPDLDEVDYIYMYIIVTAERTSNFNGVTSTKML